MHLARLCVALALVACSKPEGLWRDQYAFVGDDGTVMLLGLQRQSAGTAQAKGWLARGGVWDQTFFQEFPILGRDAPNASAVLSAWAVGPRPAARVGYERDGDRVEIGLRLPSLEVGLRSSAMTSLGTFRDPEGVSTYRVGRAQLWTTEQVWNGWLVVEETPVDRPRLPFVDYGDFAFVVLASPEGGAVVVKRSRRRPEFNRALSTRDGVVRETRDVSVELVGDELIVKVPAWDLEARALVRDRDVSRGTAPDGKPVAYETLLLGGDYAGIAVLIRPVSR